MVFKTVDKKNKTVILSIYHLEWTTADAGITRQFFTIFFF